MTVDPQRSADFVERVALALVAREHSYSSDPAYWKSVLDVTPRYRQQAIAVVDALGLEQVGHMKAHPLEQVPSVPVYRLGRTGAQEVDCG